MRALCLSGGGSRGAFQVGALKKWMLDDGTDYDILCGISVGSINAAFLAQTKLGRPGTAWHKLAELWDQVSTAKVKKNWFPLGVFESLLKQSIYDSSPLQTWIGGALNPRAIAVSGRRLRIAAVCWDTGESNLATETSRDLQSGSWPAPRCLCCFAPWKLMGSCGRTVGSEA